MRSHYIHNPCFGRAYCPRIRPSSQGLQGKAAFSFGNHEGVCILEVLEMSLTFINHLNLKMRALKVVFVDTWQSTKKRTSTGRPMDALVCPVAPSTGIPHDFNIYWGYTCLWNLLDYPSTVLPLPNFKISPETDPPNLAYEPVTYNPYDKANHELCKSQDLISITERLTHGFRWPFAIFESADGASSGFQTFR